MALHTSGGTEYDFVDALCGVLPETIPHLVAVLSKDEDTETRMVAASWLDLAVETDMDLDMVLGVATQLLDDPVEEVAAYARGRVDMLSQERFSNPTAAAAFSALLDARE